MPRDGFKHHETDFDTTRRIEYHEEIIFQVI